MFSWKRPLRKTGSVTAGAGVGGRLGGHIQQVVASARGLSKCEGWDPQVWGFILGQMTVQPWCLDRSRAKGFLNGLPLPVTAGPVFPSQCRALFHNTTAREKQIFCGWKNKGQLDFFGGRCWSSHRKKAISGLLFEL